MNYKCLDPVGHLEFEEATWLDGLVVESWTLDGKAGVQTLWWTFDDVMMAGGQNNFLAIATRPPDD